MFMTQIAICIKLLQHFCLIEVDIVIETPNICYL